jgi:hypothetical protein
VNSYRCSIIVALLLLPLASSAEELTLGVNALSAYDSNVFATEVDAEDDVSFRIEPDALLEDQEGKLQWDLRYRPSYEQFVDFNEKSGWTHLADGGLSWQVDPKTRVELSDRFGRFRSVGRFNELVTTGEADLVGDATEFGFRSDDNTRNTVDASLTHNLTPRQMLIFDLGHNLLDYDREERADHDTVSAIGRYMQVVSRRDELGAGVSYQHASLEGTSLRRSQATDFYNLFGTWRHQFDETLELSLAVGPTWIDGDELDDPVTVATNVLLYPLLSVEGETRLVRATSCPTEDGALVLTGECEVIDQELTPAQLNAVRLVRTNLEFEGPVPSGSNSSLTYFANLALSKRWERWSGTVSYRRQQSDSSDLGSSNVADVLSGALQWKPSPRWVSSLRLSLVRQAQATQAVRSAIAVRSTDLSPIFGPAFTDVAESVALRAVEVDQDIDTWTFWASLSVRYRVSERTTVFGNAIYWDEWTGAGSQFGTDYNRFRFHLGVEYQFDPIRL